MHRLASSSLASLKGEQVFKVGFVRLSNPEHAGKSTSLSGPCDLFKVENRCASQESLRCTYNLRSVSTGIPTLSSSLCCENYEQNLDFDWRVPACRQNTEFQSGSYESQQTLFFVLLSIISYNGRLPVGAIFDFA